MDKRIRLTALMLAASLLLNMVVLPVRAEEETMPSSALMSQENEPTEAATTPETAPTVLETTAETAPEETEATTAPEETTEAPTETTEETAETTQETEEAETEPELSLMADVDVPVPVNNTYTINSLAQLVGLSTLPASDYANSTIEIVIKSGDLSTEQFNGLGSSADPFAGKLIFNGDAEASLTLSRPLFNYLSTQATCTVNNSANGGYLQLTDNNAEGALLAKVLTGTGTGSSWKVTVYNSRADDVQPYSVPIIGSMEAGSAIELSVRDGYWYPVQAGNAGLLCGTMGENTKLTLTDYEQTAAKTTDYFVMATSGAAGGLVGKMGKNAELTVKPALSFPTKTIQASGGAGNLVGEMGEGAVLTVQDDLTCAAPLDAGGTAGSLVGQMGKDAQLTVKGDLTVKVTTVTAGSDAGGLVGRMAEEATLSLTKATDITIEADISGSNAGGLVGEMKDGAKLSGVSGTDSVTIRGTVTGKSHAGGLIGIAENLVLDGSMPEVTAQKITGGTTAGGLLGSYTYSDAAGDAYHGEENYPAVTADLSDSGGHTGGLYGYLKNTAGDFYLKGTKTVTVTGAKGTHVGGLVGRYEADSLTERSLYVTAGDIFLTGNGNDSYGGLIGSVNGNNGVYIEVTAAAPACASDGSAASNVGGLIGKLEGGGHMVRLSGVTVSGLPGNSASGGLVGSMAKGVLYLGKNIIINQPGSGGKNGWVLGDRDNTLVYTDQSWDPKKGTTNDIGGWGQVVRANNLLGVLTYDEAERTVTVAAPNGSDGSYSVSNAVTFAELALRYQLNENEALKFAEGDVNTSVAQTIDLTADVNYLENTGFTGFQRDINNAEQISVTLNGHGCTVTLPDIPVYAGGSNHDRQGLLARTTDLTASELTLDGEITVHGEGATYTGALCAETTNAAALTQVTGKTDITLDATDNTTYNLGNTRIAGLLGNVREAEFTDCQWSGTITDSTKSYCYIGGFCARCEGEAKITVTDCTISGSIDKADSGWSDATVGGLVASMGGYNQTMTIDGLSVDGLKITTGSNSASGGLLGYEWLNTKATITGVSVKNSTLNAGTNARFGGLVYTGSGYWRVEQGKAAETYGIHFVSGNSFTGKSEQGAPSGLITARGEKNGNLALYLELRENSYKAEGTTVDIGGSPYFDEIVGSNQSANNNGIVSIATTGHALIDRTGCNTYQSQLGQGWVNGKTRYYYNLDAYRDALATNAETGTIGENPNLGTVDTAPKMLLWDAYHDCENGLREYFSAQKGGFVISGDIDLGGYSFYPTYYINDTRIDGASITFDYDTINGFEAGNKPLNETDSQHYQMHTGIFSGGKAVEGSGDQTLSVKNLTLAGTVGRSATGYGALCCGDFSGSSPYARMYLDIDGVDLAGIRVSRDTADTNPVKPLLICSLGSYTTLDMSGVATTTGYEDLAADEYAASSLIGPVGSTTAREIHLTFKQMSLDGRPGRDNDTLYGTTGYIFSRALFLESFDYVEASSGVYNFTEAEKDACTLGRELSNASGGTVSGRNNDEQRWYYGGKLENKLVCGNETLWSSFYKDYQRYVYQPENLTTSGSTQHELDVNLNTAGLEIGCGTQTDPYIITEFSQLKTLNQVLRDGNADNWPVYLDPEVMANVKAGTSFVDTDKHTPDNVNGGHSKFEYLEGTWTCQETGATVTDANLRTYLQNAYYQLGGDITADNSWEGLGHGDTTSQDNDRMFGFSGVIDGDGHTFTVPGNTGSQFGGLIKYSMGSVIRDINVVYTGNISVVCDQVPSATLSPSFFGGVVGWCRGGDTILENVTVKIPEEPEITGNDYCLYLAAVGGFVGMVGGYQEQMSTDTGTKQVVSYGGGVVFRGTVSGELSSENTAEDSAYFYYNPCVGRVLDGYVLAEGSLKLDNTNKNYTIPTISLGTHLTREGDTVTVADAQGLWLLSAIANSGAASMTGVTNARVYAAYAYGRPRSDLLDDNDLGGVRKLKTGSYLDKFATGTFYNLAASAISLVLSKDCDMTDYGNGFRGIGTSYGAHNNGDNNRLLQISAIDGGDYTVTLNQNRREYLVEMNSWVSIGTGLFPQLRVPNGTSLTVSNLTLSGQTGIGYYNVNITSYWPVKLRDAVLCPADSFENVKTLWSSDDRLSMVSTGMLAGGFAYGCNIQSVTIEDVHLKNAAVNPEGIGTAAAGGLLGTTGNGSDKIAETLTIKDCTTDTLSVTGLVEAGGLVGFVRAKTTKIWYSENVAGDAELLDTQVTITRKSSASFGTASGIRADAGGLIGMISKYNRTGDNWGNNDGNLYLNTEAGASPLRIRNLTVSSQVREQTENNVGGLIGFGNVGEGGEWQLSTIRMEGSVQIGGSITSGASRANVGGLIGFITDGYDNKWDSTFDNKQGHYQLSISDVEISCQTGSNFRVYNGKQLGGLIALMKNPGGLMEINQVAIGSADSTTAILKGANGHGDCITGGLLGVVCLYPDMNVTNTRLEHVAVVGQMASGGAVGQIENKNWTKNEDYVPKVRLENLAIENSDIAICGNRNGVGGLYGYLSGASAHIMGFNILLKDNQIGYLLNDGKNAYRWSVPNEWTGTLPIGLVNGDNGNAGIFGGQMKPGKSGYSYTVRFTGVSLQQAENTVPTQDFGTALGEGDYLVRSDYTGVQDQETSLSEYPHVTTNPVSPLESLLGTTVTGDGACFDGTTPIGEKIRSDSSGTENRNLTHTAVEEARKYLTDADTNKPVDMAYFGSFAADGDNGDYTGSNFPVFVISTTSTDEANRALYSALSLLTNRVMYGQTIAGDLDPDAPADMTLSLTNYVYTGGQWQESQDSGSFTLSQTTKRIQLNGQYDNQKARFTLLKAEFANPADAAETVYTLYLPILVKKVFNFRFWAAALTGTSYIQNSYDDLNRLAIAADNEKVTALLGFDYTRTREEWQKAVNDGENLLWNFLKQIRLNIRLPGATRLVLVDRNNQDKAWYATAANALEQVDSYYELKFTAFQDQAGADWAPVTLSQLLPLTATELTEADETLTGKFVQAESADKATVQIGETYYRKATDEDKDQTQYAITVGEFEGDELSERYYLTLQTPANSQQLLNILLTCDDRLTNPAGYGLPTKRLPASDGNPNNGFARNGDENRIVFASCFDQTVTLTTAPGQLEMISDSYTQVEATLTATISFKDGSAQQFQNYAGDQSLSQCFNLVFYRYEGSTKTQVSLSPGTQITAVYRYGEDTWTEHYIVDTATRSYRLTFPKQIPCSDIQDHPVELTAELTLDFASSYVEQFPTRDSDSDLTGVRLAASSTLSYTPQTLASSTLTTQPPSEDTLDRRFYRGEVSVASLNYDAIGDSTQEAIEQLGINGFEGDSAELLSGASYNVSAVSGAGNARFLRCTLTLSPRNNTGTSPFVSYGGAVPWGSCLTDKKMQLSLRYTDSESGQIIEAANPTNTEDNVNATYTATFRLDSVLDKNVPLEISADMFLLAGAALEGNGMTYANYKIRLEAELLDANGNPISGSNASDYLVYTNSRIYKNIIYTES